MLEIFIGMAVCLLLSYLLEFLLKKPNHMKSESDYVFDEEAWERRKEQEEEEELRLRILANPDDPRNPFHKG